MAQAAEPIVRKRLTQAELDAICARHDRLFQARPGGARAVFAWMDLSGLCLKGRNLADADFAAACLERCDLTGARLDNANFFGADMQDAILADVSLRRADLRGAPDAIRDDHRDPEPGRPAARRWSSGPAPPRLPLQDGS